MSDFNLHFLLVLASFKERVQIVVELLRVLLVLTFIHFPNFYIMILAAIFSLFTISQKARQNL